MNDNKVYVEVIVKFSTGIMYTVMVDGKECHLYYEFDKWFMERKSA